jgi:catechol 2,3-dioxygenase-like lactoylglutathione lyase family enzyme
MQISSAIAQLRTTDLAASIRFYTTKVGLTLEFQHQDFYAGIRAGQSALSPKTRRREGPLYRVRG